MNKQFGLGGFLVRWVIALVLVLATFNPTGWSYFHWVATGESGLPYKVLAGIVLVILYVIYLRATWRSIGPIGLGLAAAFFGAVVWALVDLDLVDPRDMGQTAWIVLVVVATVLAIGISWSHVRRRVTGQTDVTESEE